MALGDRVGFPENTHYLSPEQSLWRISRLATDPLVLSCAGIHGDIGFEITKEMTFLVIFRELINTHPAFKHHDILGAPRILNDVEGDSWLEILGPLNHN
jgi:hypothetical protein